MGGEKDNSSRRWLEPGYKAKGMCMCTYCCNIIACTVSFSMTTKLMFIGYVENMKVNV